MSKTQDNLQTWYKQIVYKLKSDGQWKSWSADFKRCKADEDYVSMVYNLPFIDKVIKVCLLKEEKSSETAKQYRIKGNVMFQKNCLAESLSLYNDSILKAPTKVNSTELSLALANRSAVLHRMQRYSLCLRDISLSLKFGYPENLQYKLWDRKGKCFYQLNRLSEAVENFTVAKQQVVKLNLEPEKRAGWLKELQKQIQWCLKLDQDTVHLEFCPEESTNHEAVPEICRGRSFQFPCTSSSFSLKYEPTRGRFAIATKDINIGDVVVIEKPYTSVLIPKKYYTHCHFCCERVLAPLPCAECARVVYCSEKCQQNSWITYHYAECGFLQSLENIGVGLGHLALRIILKTGYDFLLQYREFVRTSNFQSDPVMLGFNAEGFYSSEHYHTVYNLVRHTEDRIMSDLLQRTVKAVFLLKCIETTAFFGSVDKRNQTSRENKCYIGGHILRHIQMLPCNAHEVSELEFKVDKITDSEAVELASAIYPVLSLINHSCDPSIVRHSYGDLCVARAVRNIPKGEEIVDNYGTLYPLSTKSERNEILAPQYYFTCKCEACVQDWPLYLNIPNDIPVFKCDKCSAPIVSKAGTSNFVCSKCDLVHDITQKMNMLTCADDVYQPALKNVINGMGMKEALPVLLRHLQLLDRQVCRPWRDFNMCQEAIKHCFNVVANCHIVK